MSLTIQGQTTSKGRFGNGAIVPVTGTRDGAIYVADYVQALALEGRLFTTEIGTLTTPTTFRIGVTTLQPELVIDVPSGSAIVPVEISVHLETLAGTITEIVAVTSTALRGAGTSTAGAALSTRTDRPVASGCSVYYTYSGNAVAVAGDIEFWRWGFPWVTATAEGNAIMKAEWHLNRNTPQVIVGPGSVSLYIGATTTAPTGYVFASWLELPSSAI
ncbi:MAG: hypothetical protein WC718_18415 [Phycisphaerales bacterium]|jgi:hypothetical protein